MQSQKMALHFFCKKLLTPCYDGHVRNREITGAHVTSHCSLTSSLATAVAPKPQGSLTTPFCLWQTFETLFFHHLRISRTCLDLGLRKTPLTQSFTSSNFFRERPSLGIVSKSIIPLATASGWSFEWIESLATTTNTNSGHLEAPWA